MLDDPAFQTGLRASLAVVCVVGAVLFVYYAWSIVQPLLVAIVVATALWPWVSKIASIKLGRTGHTVPRVVAAALVYITTFVTAGVVIWVALSGLVPQVDRFLDAYPAASAPVAEYIEPFRRGDIADGARRVAEQVAGEATKPNATAAGPADAGPAGINVGPLGLGLFGGLVTVGLMLVFTFFLLLDGNRFAQSAMLLLPRDQRPHARALGIRIRDRISRWVLAQVIYAAISAAVVTTAMWLLQLPSPWLYGVAAAILAIVPAIGPSLVAIPAALVALNMETWQLVGVIAFGLILYVADAAVISTRIYGGMLRIPMFVVLVSMLLGAVVMGVWGALIAPPVAAAVQMSLRDRLGRPPEPESS